MEKIVTIRRPVRVYTDPGTYSDDYRLLKLFHEAGSVCVPVIGNIYMTHKGAIYRPIGDGRWLLMDNHENIMYYASFSYDQLHKDGFYFIVDYKARNCLDFALRKSPLQFWEAERYMMYNDRLRGLLYFHSGLPFAFFKN